MARANNGTVLHALFIVKNIHYLYIFALKWLYTPESANPGLEEH